MSIQQVDQIVNAAGTGPVSFPNGFSGNVPSTYDAVPVLMGNNSSPYSPSAIANVRSQGPYISNITITGGGNTNNGTWEITFGRIGYYKVTSTILTDGGTSGSSIRLEFAPYGGTQTATLLFPGQHYLVNQSGGTSPIENSLTTISYYQVTAAGQIVNQIPSGTCYGFAAGPILHFSLAIEAL